MVEGWEDWNIEKWKIDTKKTADDLLRRTQMKPTEELTRDDVLGKGNKAFGVECQKCHKPWKRGAINVCVECIEYFCDEHIENHSECSMGR